jgi:hypothetical protein
MDKPTKVPISWEVPEGMRVNFANHLLVTNQDGQFILTFFEVLLPIILEGEEEKLKGLEEVTGTAVARLAIPPQQIPRMIEVLQKRYDHHLDKQMEKSGGE